jgi:hypothetical protein
VQLYQALVDALLRGDLLVILQLEIDGVEDLGVLQEEPPRLVGAAFEYSRRDLSRAS